MIKVIKEFTLKIIYRQEEPSATAMDISTGHMVNKIRDAVDADDNDNNDNEDDDDGD